jgi:hypothetical protein
MALQVLAGKLDLAVTGRRDRLGNGEGLPDSQARLRFPSVRRVERGTISTCSPTARG